MGTYYVDKDVIGTNVGSHMRRMHRDVWQAQMAEKKKNGGKCSIARAFFAEMALRGRA